MLDKLVSRAAARRHPIKSRDEIRTDVIAHHDAIGRAIAKRYSRGNVNIKRGAYLTRDDIDARKKR
jgi:hypothetical protein